MVTLVFAADGDSDGGGSCGTKTSDAQGTASETNGGACAAAGGGCGDRATADLAQEIGLILGPRIDEQHACLLRRMETLLDQFEGRLAQNQGLPTFGAAAVDSSAAGLVGERKNVYPGNAAALAEIGVRTRKSFFAGPLPVEWAEDEEDSKDDEAANTGMGSTDTTGRKLATRARLSRALSKLKRTGTEDLFYGSGRSSELHRLIHQVVHSPWFDMSCGVLIIMNAVLIGWEIEYQAQNGGETSSGLATLQTIFGLIFMVELIVRGIGFGRELLKTEHFRWYLFDTVLVFTFIIDFVLDQVASKDLAMSGQGAGRLLRTARFCRILRTFRLLRVTAQAREFRKMCYALQYSIQTLFWAVLLLLFVMYCFATTFTQATIDYIQEVKREEADAGEADLLDLQSAYGSLFRALYTLYLSLTTGVSWGEAARPLFQLHGMFIALFLFFITVTLLGVMNVLTSVFVDSALQSTQHYRDIKVQEAEGRKREHMAHLRAVFTEIDADESGDITTEEIQLMLQEPRLLQYLSSMEVCTEDAEMLFKLLDKDDSGRVSIDEFCQGCLRLKGEAKSFDIHQLMYQNQRLHHKFLEFFSHVDDNFRIMIDRAIIARQISPHSSHAGGDDEFHDAVNAI